MGFQEGSVGGQMGLQRRGVVWASSPPQFWRLRLQASVPDMASEPSPGTSCKATGSHVSIPSWVAAAFDKAVLTRVGPGWGTWSGLGKRLGVLCL